MQATLFLPNFVVKFTKGSTSALKNTETSWTEISYLEK